MKGKRRRTPLVHRSKPLTGQQTSPAAAATGGCEEGPGGFHSAKSRHTRTIIRRFHHILKMLASSATTQSDKRALTLELESMGGLQAYQSASLLGQSRQRGGDTSRWLLPHISDLISAAGTLTSDGASASVARASASVAQASASVAPTLPHRRKLRLLDVGALQNNYVRETAWIESTCIDLNARSAEVRQLDFLELEPEHDGTFDVVCLSLVLNFQPDPAVRGQMLARAHRVLRAEGESRMFIVLPRPCVDNSRYTDHEHFVGLVETLGFRLVVHHYSAKLAYFLFRRLASVTTIVDDKEFTSRRVRNQGPTRNNFSVVLPRSRDADTRPCIVGTRQ